MAELQKMYEVKEVVNTAQSNVLGVQVIVPNNNYDNVVTLLNHLEFVKKIMVYDSFGRMVLVKEINDYLCTLDLHHLDGGLYFIQAIKADGDRPTAKVIKN